ncbi:hypothetical protein HXA34_19980 [Salipaludibacillus agaradhaerens]|jgi:hypothetical protein|uniref:hypothetical protein n=1 Tax=Salipaludibacillus agaradhaerens TaxID=76935 RepID=UPI0021515027|nr:hypothetical protein [Salipaludibacillus agaradhaerens]MCR6108570.1 hypothetical protein [Salipaludibacillus agaradhaerens]MCR6120599.1 hypothetical protein [Salipaludibacillus agaradhaerens]
MNNVAEIKKRMTHQSQHSGELSVLTKWLRRQTNLIKDQTTTSQKQVEMSNSQLQWLELIHDRLDTVAMESRVTNMLLAELVALHQLVVSDDTNEARDAIRNDVYQRVRNAE